MTFDAGIEKAKQDLAAALMAPHPELLTMIMSDTGSAAVADAIEKLISLHFLKHMGAMHCPPATTPEGTT